MRPKFIFQEVMQKEQSTTEHKSPSLLKLRSPQKRSQGVILTPGTQKILPASFSWLVLGKPGSGKSYFIREILDQPSFYWGKFDRIIYIGPARYNGVIHDEYNTSTQFDMKFIEKRINQAKPWAKNMLIVMDDVVSQLSSSQKGRLQQLFFNRRHIIPQGTISIMLTSQKLTSVPTWIRSTLTSITVFGIPKSQIKVLFNELPIISNMAAIKNTFEVMQPHQFVYINLEFGKAFNHQFEMI